MALIDVYLARTPRSRELFERATALDPRRLDPTTVFNPPYPPYMVRGEGLRIVDVRRQRVPRLPRQLHVADPRATRTRPSSRRS